MEAQHPEHAAFVAHHRQHADRLAAVAFHFFEGIDRQGVAADRDRIGRHQIAGRQQAPFGWGMALQGAPQVAIGNDSPQLAGLPFPGHPAGPHPVGGEVGNHLRQGGERFQGPQGCGAHHQVGGGQGQLLAQGTGRVVEGKVLGRDAPPFHPHRRQGIANGHGHRRAGGGGQVERTDLAVHRGIQHHVTTPRQAGVDPAH